jgi:protein-S-isoprenylcysteine O-methyltransferase Ste14
MGGDPVPESWEPFGLIVLDGCWGLFFLVWLAGVVHNARHAPPVARRGGVSGSLLGGVPVVLVLIGGLGLWLLVMAVGVLIAELKLRAEERLLSSAFPEQYAEFRRRVPQLIPLARLPRS